MRTKIMELRIQKGLTRDEITKTLRISEREYELIELGLKEISKEMERKIYDYMQLNGA